MPSNHLMTAPVRLLLLGGTTESLALAERLAGDDRRIEVTTSLAGRTLSHRPLPGRLRVGGFGGVSGLADYLVQRKIGLVVDATHPFAATISHHAAAACEQACGDMGVPRLQLLRPAWTMLQGDRWLEAPDMAAAAALLPGCKGCIFLAVGRQELPAFAELSGLRMVARMVDTPAEPSLLPNCEMILDRGPFDRASEEALFDHYGFAAVVSKNSGGSASYAKIAVARSRGLPVIMITRPTPPLGERVETVEQAVEWVSRQLK
ncbi:MAG: cobalt-precorrin-6A reductase [Rhodospirillaceae bacterium]